IIIEAAEYAKMSGGADRGLPPGIDHIISELVDPKLDWREIIRNKIQTRFRKESTWRRPNKRYLQNGFVLPSHLYGETVSIALAIDTSGSISEEMIREVISEIVNILNFYKNFSME